MHHGCRLVADGTRIVYSDAKYWHLGGIYRMNADGTNKVSLEVRGWADPWGFSGMVDWSTDGSKLVFQQTGEGANGLWTLDAADGSDLTRK